MSNEAGPTSGDAIHEYLTAQLGTDKAWRTTSEIARALGVDTLDGRNSISKSLWGLRRRNGGPLVMTRKRAGLNVDESMALVIPVREKRAKPGRAEVVMPGSVLAVPAPSAKTPTPDPVVQVERIEKALTLADVLARHKRDRNGPIEEQLQADAVVEAAASEAPVEVITIKRFLDGDDISYASEVPALDIKAECAAIAERCGLDDGTRAEPPESSESPNLSDELRAFGEQLERGKREPALILCRSTKQSLLRDLAALAPPLIAHYLQDIAADLERAGA